MTFYTYNHHFAINVDRNNSKHVDIFQSFSHIYDISKVESFEINQLKTLLIDIAVGKKEKRMKAVKELLCTQTIIQDGCETIQTMFQRKSMVKYFSIRAMWNEFDIRFEKMKIK